jgi:hypothetical protein
VTSDTARGACLCGSVTFDVRWPSLWCAHCHCSLCRRQHGAAFVTWVGVAEERFTLLTGADELREHASTPEARRSFCGACGTPLLFRSTRWPGEVHVTLASLQGPADRAPQAHAFWESHVDWVEPRDDLPRRTSPG